MDKKELDKKTQLSKEDLEIVELPQREAMGPIHLHLNNLLRFNKLF